MRVTIKVSCQWPKHSGLDPSNITPLELLECMFHWYQFNVNDVEAVIDESPWEK